MDLPKAIEFHRLGQALYGDIPEEQRGAVISLSGDGMRLAVVGDGEEVPLRVFAYNNGGWHQVGSDFPELSETSVSLSADGSRLAIVKIVATPSSSSSSASVGLVYEYNAADAAWGPISSNLLEAAPVSDHCCYRVSLSADGNRVAMATPEIEGPGVVKVFDYAGASNWIQVGQAIEGEDRCEEMGESVSLSADGRRLAIGSPHDDAVAPEGGSVRVYEFDQVRWVQLGGTMYGDAGDRSGLPVSLSSDGSHLAVGGYRRARVYKFSGGSWAQMGNDVLNDGPTDHQAAYHLVSLSADGSRMGVGVRGLRAMVYDYSVNGTWIPTISKGGDGRPNEDGTPQDELYAYAASLSADGTRLAVGSPRNNDVVAWGGHVAVYQLPAKGVCPQGERWDVSLCTGDTYADVSGCTPCSTTCSSGYFLDGCDGSWTAGPEQCTACTCPEGRYISNTACPGTTLTNGAECTKCGAGCTLGQYVNLTLCTGSTTSDVSCVDCDPSFECSEGEFIKGCDGGVRESYFLRIVEGKTLTLIPRTRPASCQDCAPPDSTASQIGGDIQGTCKHRFRGKWGVSLSADGTRVATSALHGPTKGHRIQVVEYVGESWRPLGSDLLLEADPPDPTVPRWTVTGVETWWWRECRVALSADGNRLGVAVSYGKNQVYEYTGGDWAQLGADIALATDVKENCVIALSADGGRVALGCPGSQAVAGSVVVMSYAAGWTQVGQIIYGEVGDLSPASVSLSAAGHRVAIGAPGADSAFEDAGRTRVYEFDGTSWAQVGADIDGGVEISGSGNSVALSAAGTHVAIGTPQCEAAVYAFDGAAWVLMGSALRLCEWQTPQPEHGTAVSLSSDGRRLAVGTAFSKSASAAYVFDFNGTAWNEVGRNRSFEVEFANAPRALGVPKGIGAYLQHDDKWLHVGRAVSLSADGSIVAISADRLWGAAAYNGGIIKVFQLPNRSVCNFGERWDQNAQGILILMCLAVESAGVQIASLVTFWMGAKEVMKPCSASTARECALRVPAQWGSTFPSVALA